MGAHAEEQFIYLTTIGRKTGHPREIEIWFVKRDGRVYILAEHGYKAQWVRNILVNPSVTVTLSGKRWEASVGSWNLTSMPTSIPKFALWRAKSMVGETGCP